MKIFFVQVFCVQFFCELLYDPAILLLTIHSKELKRGTRIDYLHIHVLSSIIHHSHKVEATNMSINKLMGLPCRSKGKESACNAGDPGSIHGLGRSSGEGNGNSLQYSYLENPMEDPQQSTVHRVAKSHTGLSNWACMHMIKFNL